jgi:hypothetical protein
MKIYSKNIIVFFLLCIFQNVYSKRILDSSHKYLKEKINRTHWFKFTPLLDIVSSHPEIRYQLCTLNVIFEFKPFPLSIDQSKQPSKGFLLSTFIVNIPNGIVQGMNGLVLIDNQCIDEMIWRGCPGGYLNAKLIEKQNILHISGKVAVITQSGYDNYFHWHTELLSRLALLDIQGIEYDYVYAPQKSKYMKDLLKMWGVPESKIIAPTSEDFAVQADEIILPSLVCNSNHGWTQFVNYVRPELLEYVKNKLFKAAQAKNIDTSRFSKKIFISRKDAPIRKVVNEDEIFEKFQNLGFERYELSKLSVAEQIMLFYQAEIIVSFQGTGLANSIYCTKKTKIIELFQGLCDCTFWYISQQLDLDYTPIQTIMFERDFLKAWKADSYVPLSIIEKVTEFLKKAKS